MNTPIFIFSRDTHTDMNTMNRHSSTSQILHGCIFVAKASANERPELFLCTSMTSEVSLLSVHGDVCRYLQKQKRIFIQIVEIVSCTELYLVIRTIALYETFNTKLHRHSSVWNYKVVI